MSSFPCQTCGRPMSLEPGTGTVRCDTIGCAARAPVPLWRAQQLRSQAGHGPDGTPAGLPRPELDGRPVPWITPVADGVPWWRLVHGERLVACQADWLCQLCGTALPPTAWVLLTAEGRVVTDAALHRACLRMALRWCPHFAPAEEFVARAVSRVDLHADGVPLADCPPAGTRRTWTVPQAGHDGLSPSGSAP